MKDFVVAHWEIISLAAAYIFLGLVSCLPEPGDPRPLSTKVYDTLYKLAHVLANKVVERKPGLALPPPTNPNP